MSERYDWAAASPEERDAALEAAATALRRGDLVVLPTDTVYGIAADAFEAPAVAGLLAAKGRGRQMPPPVLVGSVGMLDGIAASVPDSGRALISAFWPGPLTIVCQEQPSLVWDLGENEGTVAVRMPDHELALELLGRTGPLAVSSANLSGQAAATTADDAEKQLGESVAVYLDDGPTPGPLPSSIVDLTGPEPVLLREGALTFDQLREVVPTLVEYSEEPDEAEEAEPEPVAEAEPEAEAEAAEPVAEAEPVAAEEPVAEADQHDGDPTVEKETGER